jgi:hypothetical protein
MQFVICGINASPVCLTCGAHSISFSLYGLCRPLLIIAVCEERADLHSQWLGNVYPNLVVRSYSGARRKL